MPSTRPERGSTFSVDYETARERFLAATGALGGALRRHENPVATAGVLTTDVATFGPDDASRGLLVISGTHGLEGPAGSAGQSAWLESRARAGMPGDVRVVVVHALNPWGFAHWSRTNEDNVDLNRNFVDFASGLPDNPRYRELHAIACPDRLETGTLDAIEVGLKRYAVKHGYDALNDGLGGGQYAFADGLHYGGTGPTWSRRVLESVIERELAGIPRVGVIDWHTGRGEFGQPFFLCFSPPGSRGFRRAIDWWGEQAIVAKDSIGEAYEGDAPPPRSGLLFSGVERALGAETETAGAVIEFGTYPPDRVIRAELIDRLLKFGDTGEHQRAALRAAVIEAFCPADAAWRAAVERAGIAITEQAVAGLQRWA